MNVNPTSGTQPLAQTQAARKAYGGTPTQPSAGRAADRLELSGASHLLQMAKSNDVRMEKVQMLKDQIEAGTYDLDAKAETVADRLLDDLSL